MRRIPASPPSRVENGARVPVACVTETRARLRRELRARRRAIPAAERIAAAQSLARRLLELPFAPASGHVAGYWIVVLWYFGQGIGSIANKLTLGSSTC